VDYEKKRIERYSPREFKIERVQELLEALGNPQKEYPTVHIAGTKGKGSVSAMMALCAQTGGLSTGLYTSPHLHTYRERIQINGRPISRTALANLVNEIKPFVDARPALTTFEVATALAFLYFAQKKVDLAVMEVGLGGRLDATNVITPQISIITSLSLDHTYLLGDTLADIAREKAGIIKPGVPVVSAPQKPKAISVLRDIAHERNAALTVVGREWQWIAGQRLTSHQTLTVKRQDSSSAFDGEYELALLGEFQMENAAVAVTSTAVLAEQGLAWATPKTIKSALQKVSWPGRMEILNENLPLIVDCAHNPYSAEKLIESLKIWFPEKRWVLIYGASTDKDIDGMLRALLPVTENVIVTRSYHPRAAAPYVLADKCADIGQGAEIAVDAQHALGQAFVHINPDTGILATGSIFLVADVREAWGKQEDLEIPLGDWVDEPW
jgi:dihydrofolate synthase/folylpolyglutamate synthase